MLASKIKNNGEINPVKNDGEIRICLLKLIFHLLSMQHELGHCCIVYLTYGSVFIFDTVF